MLSHFTVYETELENVTESVVEKTFQALLSEALKTDATAKLMHPGMWHNEYDETDEYIIAGIKTKEVPRGIGVRLEQGKLKIVGDGYGQVLGFQNMLKSIKGFATMEQLKEATKCKHKIASMTPITRHDNCVTFKVAVMV